MCNETNTMGMCSVASVASNSASLWTVARQALLSVEFSRQEYWSGLPCHPSRDLPNPRIEPNDRIHVSYISALARKFFTTSNFWEA